MSQTLQTDDNSLLNNKFIENLFFQINIIQKWRNLSIFKVSSLFSLILLIFVLILYFSTIQLQRQ